MYFKTRIQNLSYQGIAAGLVHGQTIHEFLGMSITGSVGKNKRKSLRNKLEN